MHLISTFTKFSLGFTFVLLLQSCGSQPAATVSSPTSGENQLTFSGSSTLAEIISEVGKRYEATRPGVKIDVQKTSSWRGVTDAKAGVAQIGLVNRPLKGDEKDLAAFTIARDGIAVIINKANPVKSLTNQQIADIYQKKLKNWKEVGGKNAAIVTVSRTEGRASLEQFLDYFKLEKSNLRADVIVGDTHESTQSVINNPNAISYSSLNDAETSAASGKPVKLLPIDGVAATTATVKNGSYPLARPLNLVTKNPPSASVQDFIDFALSAEGQEIVKQQNVVPIK